MIVFQPTKAEVSGPSHLHRGLPIVLSNLIFRWYLLEVNVKYTVITTLGHAQTHPYPGITNFDTQVPRYFTRV